MWNSKNIQKKTTGNWKIVLKTEENCDKFQKKKTKTKKNVYQALVQIINEINLGELEPKYTNILLASLRDCNFLL